MFCVHCEIDFDPRSIQKRRAGGKINECAECVEELGTEVAVKYLGCQSGDGKMGGVTILAFDSDADRETYRRAWNDNSGMDQGKSCQLSSSNTVMGDMKFRRVGENFGNSNHKGRK